MLNIKFKSLKITKDNLHNLNYIVKEVKGDASISSNISVCVNYLSLKEEACP